MPIYPSASSTEAQDNPQMTKFTNIDQILAGANTVKDIPLAISQITAVLHERHHIANSDPDDFTLRNMTEMTDTLTSTTRMMTMLLVCVAAISLVVGGVGIMNIMMVSVTERTREIGLRMAVGAKSKDILWQFLVEAVVLCLIGGLCRGAVSGALTSIIVTALMNWPTQASPSAAAVVALAVSLPAWELFLAFTPRGKPRASTPSKPCATSDFYYRLPPHAHAVPDDDHRPARPAPERAPLGVDMSGHRHCRGGRGGDGRNRQWLEHADPKHHFEPWRSSVDGVPQCRRQQRHQRGRGHGDFAYPGGLRHHLESECPAVRNTAPIVRGRGQVVYNNLNWAPNNIVGSSTAYCDIHDWAIAEGTNFTDEDTANSNQVCIIGDTVAENLFGEESPVGQRTAPEERRAESGRRARPTKAPMFLATIRMTCSSRRGRR